MEPAVLVMASSRAASRGSALEPLLGIDGWERLDAVLLARAARWALRAAPTAAFLAHPADAGPALALVPEAVECFAQAGDAAPQRLAAAVTRVFAVHGGPVVVVRSDFPRLGGYHADAVLGDLREGCDVVLGVAMGGGLYLLGMREPQPRLFALAGTDADGETTRRNAREVTDGLDLDVGMLHYERAVVGPADVTALLADPLAPGDVLEALQAARTRPDGG